MKRILEMDILRAKALVADLEKLRALLESPQSDADCFPAVDYVTVILDACEDISISVNKVIAKKYKFKVS